MKTPYDVLGVPRNASNERIRTAFRKAAKTHHPDLNSDDPTAEQQIKRVIAAYEILKNPRKRAACDRYLRAYRRARVRQFATSAVASLGGILVAFAVSLAVWQSNTQEASAAPPTLHMQSAMVSADTRQQLDGGRPEVNRGRKSDWDGVPDDGARDRQQTAVSLFPAAGSRELYAVLAREREVQANGEPMAYAARAPETGLARSEAIAAINAAAPAAYNSLKKPSLEERAGRFVSSQIAGWSSSKASDVGSLASAYADNVRYYGSRKSRQAVLLEKRRELELSPARVYDVQRDSMRVRCSANMCKVNGTMAWQTRNGHHPTSARGISKFDYEITPSGDSFRIDSESSSVVKRSQQAGARNHGRLTRVTANQQRCERPTTSNESSNPFDQMLHNVEEIVNGVFAVSSHCRGAQSRFQIGNRRSSL